MQENFEVSVKFSGRSFEDFEKIVYASCFFDDRQTDVLLK
jgi:hypothetical protein